MSCLTVAKIVVDRVERFKISLARAKRLKQLEGEHKWTEDESRLAGLFYMPFLMSLVYTADYLVDDALPYTLHKTMFVTVSVDGKLHLSSL